MEALAKLKTDSDIGSFLDSHFKGEQYDDLRDSVKGLVEGYDAADLRRVSALALREEWSEQDVYYTRDKQIPTWQSRLQAISASR